MGCLMKSWEIENKGEGRFGKRWQKSRAGREWCEVMENAWVPHPGSGTTH